MVERVKPRDVGREIFMEVAWRDFIFWAHGFPPIRAHFKAATGKGAL